MLSADYSPRLHAISAQACRDEKEAVSAALGALQGMGALEPRIHATAKALIEGVREEARQGWMEAFLQEYGLENEEGLALMRLAEALLRIPDSETADRLIRDMLADGQWQKHLGKSEVLLVNAASIGLMLTGKLLSEGAWLKRTVARMGEPAVRLALKGAMKRLGAEFVLGETMSEALKNSAAEAKKGYRFSYDMLGEGARSAAQAAHYMEAYRQAISAIAAINSSGTLEQKPGISVKLSALHPRYQLTQKQRVMEELLPRVRELLLHARQADIMVSLDAEEASRLDVELELFTALFLEPALAGWEGLGFVVQAYQKRALMVIEYLAQLASDAGRRMPLRLVKGAYWDSEIKFAQMQGLAGYPVFTRKIHTDVNYLACAKRMLERMDCFLPQFATHNAHSMAGIMTLAEEAGVKEGAYEFQRLHGMGEALHERVVARIPSRIYAPVGRHRDLLPYLIRRLLENGANTSFVHQLTDASVPTEALLADPVAQTQAGGGDPHPHIPLPQKLYGSARINSQGVDFGNRVADAALQQKLAAFAEKRWSACPLVADNNTAEAREMPLFCPADGGQMVGTVQHASAHGIGAAFVAAQQGFSAWSNTPVEIRATALERLADAIESARAELMALCAREAGRTLADGLAEVREAADFCRYYAQQARILLQPHALTGPTGESNMLSLHPRGVFVCISPWNFPLAIFTGQIAAAVVTGNMALAKPAEQTPLMAARVVELMHAAGIPRDVAQLLPGDGETVGAALVADTRTDGVVFTGSVATARRIALALSQRQGGIVPFIAETGGQNCMVVDSSALLEQAVDDILLSAFGSAGQRCSALRVLYVQEEVAEEMITLIQGAMRELRVGNPLEVATDIGPVIDESAREKLLSHIARMEKEAKLIARASLPPGLAEKGWFLAAHAFEIDSITRLPEEVFGPVLHLIRFRADAMAQVAEDINRTGYGLTFGIHSRIGETIDFFCSRVKAGNRYVNRGMTGAVVGVQPFGGEGLSGTGPKAGGPHYLLRFLTERTLSVNTAAIGGNASLLAGKGY